MLKFKTNEPWNYHSHEKVFWSVLTWESLKMHSNIVVILRCCKQAWWITPISVCVREKITIVASWNRKPERGNSTNKSTKTLVLELLFFLLYHSDSCIFVCWMMVIVNGLSHRRHKSIFILASVSKAFKIMLAESKLDSMAAPAPGRCIDTACNGLDWQSLVCLYIYIYQYRYSVRNIFDEMSEKHL